MRSSDIPPHFLSVNDHLYPAKNIAVLISEQKTIIIELANIESSQITILHTNLKGRDVLSYTSKTIQQYQLLKPLKIREISNH